MVNDSSVFIRTNEFEWPQQLDTEERDQKIISILAQAAADKPENSALQQALENARRLHDLIPRAKALKWYILLFRDYFTFLTWDKELVVGGITSYLPPSGTSAINNLERLIIDAEEDGGIPEEVKATILSNFYSQLQDQLYAWRQEGKELD